MPFKTIHRYILAELLVVFFLSLLALNLVIMTDQLISLTRRLGAVGASFLDIARLILYLQPQTALLTAPMAMMISIIFTYGRLNTDNELTVMRASGMSYSSILAPVYMLGIGCFLFGLLLGFYISPAGARSLRAEVSGIIASRAPYALEEGIFNTAFKDIIIHVKERPSRDAMSGIFIYDERKPEQPRTLYAKSGRVTGAGGYRISLDLADGAILILKGNAVTELSFRRYNLILPIALEKPRMRYGELRPEELLGRAATVKPEERTTLLLEFWRRLTFPSSCLLLMLLGPPLSLKSGKTGRLGGLAIAIFVFASYYASMLYFENLALSGRLPHYAGAWGPNLLLFPLSVWLFMKASSR